jgi:hypothetical protein
MPVTKTEHEIVCTWAGNSIRVGFDRTGAGPGILLLLGDQQNEGPPQLALDHVVDTPNKAAETRASRTARCFTRRG